MNKPNQQAIAEAIRLIVGDGVTELRALNANQDGKQWVATGDDTRTGRAEGREAGAGGVGGACRRGLTKSKRFGMFRVVHLWKVSQMYGQRSHGAAYLSAFQAQGGPGRRRVDRFSSLHGGRHAPRLV